MVHSFDRFLGLAATTRNVDLTYRRAVRLLSHRPSRALLLVGCLVLGSCGGKSSSTTAPSGSGKQSYGDAGALDITTAPTTAPPTTAAPAGAKGKPATATTAAKGQSTAPTSPPTTFSAKAFDRDPYAAAKGQTGGFSRTLLRPAPATSVVLELMIEDGGRGPSPTTKQLILDNLRKVSGKEVKIPDPLTIPVGPGSYHSADLTKRADQYTKYQQGDGDQAVFHVLYLKGHDADGDGILGIAVRGDTLAVFPDELDKAVTPLVPYDKIEQAVTLHETGHILGLVDLARKTGREDPAHPGHSANKGSVMYWAVDGSLIGQVFGGPPPTTFDADDLADMKVLREGG